MFNMDIQQPVPPFSLDVRSQAKSFAQYCNEDLYVFHGSIKYYSWGKGRRKFVKSLMLSASTSINPLIFKAVMHVLRA